MDNRESYVDKIVDRGLEKPKCVKSGKFKHYTWRKYWKNWKCPQVVHSKTESYPQGYPQIVDNVDYGYKISCGKHKNRTDICTRAADSVDKLWINRKSAHGRHGQRQTGKPRQSGIFPEKTAKIIDFRVDETGVYEYN